MNKILDCKAKVTRNYQHQVINNQETDLSGVSQRSANIQQGYYPSFQFKTFPCNIVL